MSKHAARVPAPNLLTVAQAATALGVQPQSLYQRVRYRRSVRCVILGGRIYFDARDIAALAAAKATRPRVN